MKSALCAHGKSTMFFLPSSCHCEWIIFIFIIINNINVVYWKQTSKPSRAGRWWRSDFTLSIYYYANLLVGCNIASFFFMYMRRKKYFSYYYICLRHHHCFWYLCTSIVHHNKLRIKCQVEVINKLMRQWARVHRACEWTSIFFLLLCKTALSWMNGNGSGL